MKDYNKLELCPTDVQAMMEGVFETGKIIRIRNGFRMVCVDGNVWEIVSPDSMHVYTINPTNAVYDSEIVDFLISVTAKESRGGGSAQLEASSDD